MYIGLYLKYSSLLLNFKEIAFSLHVFEKYRVVKYHENSSSGSRVVPCGRTDRHAELYVQVTVHRDNLRINNQDASISKILFCHETLHVSGIFCANHQELSAVHVAIGMFHAGYVVAA
jgi:hypothetical protein